MSDTIILMTFCLNLNKSTTHPFVNSRDYDVYGDTIIV